MLSKELSTTANLLTRKGIRPSYQRIRIMAYLNQSERHPTVEDIFAALSLEIPSLSKATVYNTLHTLIEAGLVRVLNIEHDAQRYDPILENHGHFRCERCGQIFNFDIDMGQINTAGLQGFQIEKKDVYFSGLCPECQKNN
ncbi:MAG: transcriptional repressor [Chloroflexi bacterium]|jgi:Fe2+ or Zn2+ uptake regulation protein|nr:transcriptional repressor [Chloroflexota bacterium]